MKSKNNLIEFLSDSRTVAYFGQSFSIKVEVLAALIRGDSLNAVAEKFGVTRHAVRKHARAVRKLKLVDTELKVTS